MLNRIRLYLAQRKLNQLAQYEAYLRELARDYERKATHIRRKELPAQERIVAALELEIFTDDMGGFA